MAGATGQAPATPQTTTLNDAACRSGSKVTGNKGERTLGSYSAGSSAAVYAPGFVDGRVVEMLVDTGSAVTLVHKRLLDRIGVVKVLEGVEDRVVSANGQPLGILGRCDLRIGIGGVDELHPVLVANDVTQDCLIGVDFLARHKVKIDFAAGLVCANGQSVGLHCGGGVQVLVCVDAFV